MRNPTYLALSRHGIYHLRWRLPGATPFGGKPAFLKVSLGTRDPKQALKLARMLTEKAVSSGYGPGCQMRYEELRTVLRTYFGEALAEHRERLSATGPLTPAQRKVFQDAAEFGQMAVETDSPLLLSVAENEATADKIVEKYNLPLSKGSEPYDQLMKLYALAYRDFSLSVIRHSDRYANFDLDATHIEARAENQPSNTGIGLDKLTQMYFAEAKKGGQWAGKTEFEKAEHIELLKEILGSDTDIRTITLQMARDVKERLLRYPRNRRKNPITKTLPLADLIALQGLQTLNAQTINKYLQTYGTMFEWGKRNGYVTENVFSGLTIRSTKRAAITRKAFNAEQIKRIYSAIVLNEGDKIKLPYQKWGPLIGLYTGARLNEIAQIHLRDIRQEAGLWYIDLNDDDGKKLKTEASRRIVPLHNRLIDLGLLEYVEELHSKEHTRLFPTFTYCTKNGWGRALGRWFNDRFLPDLGIKNESLVFHSLRHTVTNSLQREDVPQAVVQALIGHTRGDMLGQHYSASGFKLRQLHDAVQRLPY